MMKPDISCGYNFAEIRTPKIQMLYGYTEDSRSEEYCFTVHKNGKEVFRKTNSELLDVSFGESPKDMLIAGIALYFSKL